MCGLASTGRLLVVRLLRVGREQSAVRTVQVLSDGIGGDFRVARCQNVAKLGMLGVADLEEVVV